ncbi:MULTISPECIES: hypothetical protein [unclassified Pseudofrankia]|uniref:hypothetical protein n=1 Tax=unclassified Pseudofrankia TaxID=2994372 RepID=UPI001F51C6B8|nr:MULTISPECIES: hypothetical protein [unclassified Pseudofrankia]MDT3445843.1 hypothetical protein [Pseudofrankia sp. BMG5.37]
MSGSARAASTSLGKRGVQREYHGREQLQVVPERVLLVLLQLGVEVEGLVP